MYKNGLGVAQDHQEAGKWFRLAADQGFAAWNPGVDTFYDELTRDTLCVRMGWIQNLEIHSSDNKLILTVDPDTDIASTPRLTLLGW
jgi:hypothetical protein